MFEEIKAAGPGLLPPDWVAARVTNPTSIRHIRPAPLDPGNVRIGWYGGWSVEIHVMLFNDRLLLVEPDPLGAPFYSWCFRKGGAAHLAALMWEPETEAAPQGYIKAAAQWDGHPRQVGERAPWWHPPLS